MNAKWESGWPKVFPKLKPCQCGEDVTCFQGVNDFSITCCDKSIKVDRHYKDGPKKGGKRILEHYDKWNAI